jgi:agmatinase
MARVKETCPFVQVGIRSMDIAEEKNITRERVFFAENIYDHNRWMNKAVSLLSNNVYITIDLDVFELGSMMSTGTPEPGGLGWYQVIRLLKKIVSKKNVVGFDIVELCPKEVNKASNFLAAKLLYKILAYIYTKKQTVN